MGKLNEYIKIYNYAVCSLYYNGEKVPIIIDLNIYKIIVKLDKSWHVNDKGLVVTTYKIHDNNGDNIKEIYLHDIVMKLNNKNMNKPILHINKIGVDNRLCNLMYDTCDKDILKNIKKKSRTVNLPKESNINPDEIPSFVWYLKEDDTHGDRFIIELGDIRWKSTASKKVSLRYKLEETKKYLRYLKYDRPDLFEDYSMNGDLNNEGKKILDSFIEISQKAGFNNIKKINNNTDKYIAQNLLGLSKEEIVLLNLFDPENNRINFR